MSFEPDDSKQATGLPVILPMDKAAFKEIFLELYQPLCLYCKLKYGFDIYQAEEIVTAGFLKFWEARQSIDSGSSPKSYLYKIVDNSSLNSLRRKKVENRYAEDFLKGFSENLSPGGFNSIEVKELNEAINAAIAELPEQMRIIFELKRGEGLKYAEIADRLNISVKTVDTQMARAMSRLKDKLSRFLTVLIFMIFNLIHR